MQRKKGVSKSTPTTSQNNKPAPKCRFYKSFKKHYTLWTILTHIMVAIGFVGFAIIGVLTPLLTTMALFCWVGVIGAIFFVGKFLDQQIDAMSEDNRSCR